jgi:hypothetical protein
MLQRTQASNGRPLRRHVVNRARRSFKREIRTNRVLGRVEIRQNQQGFRYLKWRGAEACTLSKVLVILGAHPSRSTLCEELLHVIQYDKHMHEYAVVRHGQQPATYVTEYLAARVLVSREQRWNIPLRERLDNRRRLRQYQLKIRKEIGGVPWPLRLKFPAWTNYLAAELEFWMGKSLTEKSSSGRRRNWSMKADVSRCS